MHDARRPGGCRLHERYGGAGRDAGRASGIILPIMASVLDPHIAELRRLCRRFGVARLELFGSATTDAFDPERSDLDFLVDFDANPADLFKRYFGLKESIEALYGREVDLVMTGAMANPYFIEAVNQTRQLVYAAEDAQAA
jgi:hypothetical protein